MAPQLDLLELLSDTEWHPPLDELLTPDQIYESSDPAIFVRLAEDDRFDRKSSRTPPNGLGSVFSAFSNGPSTRGGVVVFGINDKSRDVDGCLRLSEDRIQAIESASMVFCPGARVVSRRVRATNLDGRDDFIILFRVHYVHDRLIATSDGKAYERLGDKTREIDDVRKQQLRVDKGERPFEVEACTLPYPGAFDRPAIGAYCKRIRSSRSLTSVHADEDILSNIRLGSRVGARFIPNNACALLFAKDPRIIFPGAIVHFLKYNGTEELFGKEYNVEKDRQIEGNIVTIIRDAAAFIDTSLREFTAFVDGKFVTVEEYPRDAWYELLVNACVHRSYLFRTIPIFVKMFDDKIVFQSPGGLMPGVTPQNIYDRHHPRNRIIMDALRELGEVRCINEGTKRVRREMERANLPPPVFRDEAGEAASVRAILYNNIRVRAQAIDARIVDLLGDEAASLSEEERRILNHVAEQGRATVSGIMELLGDTRWHTTSVKLSRLARKGALVFRSTKPRDPLAFYELASREGSAE